MLRGKGLVLVPAQTDDHDRHHCNTAAVIPFLSPCCAPDTEYLPLLAVIGHH